MFICENCMKEEFENKPESFMIRSYGTCEICGDTSHCIDIHHSRVISKKPIKDRDIDLILERLSESD